MDPAQAPVSSSSEPSNGQSQYPSLIQLPGTSRFSSFPNHPDAHWIESAAEAKDPMTITVQAKKEKKERIQQLPSPWVFPISPRSRLAIAMAE
eukprot:scaffold33270_cov51-Attheya_sp.AAC.2